MSDVHEVRISGLEFFVASVLKPAIFSQPFRLNARAHVTRRAISIDDARRRAFREVKPGWTWGPAWATCWFQLSGRIPESLAGGEVVLRFSSGTEALLWGQGAPRRGFDRYRDAVRIYGAGLGAAAEGEHVDLWIEAACNPPLSLSPPMRDDGELARLWQSEEPGLFERAELCRFHPEVLALEQAFSFACGLVRELEPGSARRLALEGALDLSRRIVCSGEVAGKAAEATESLRGALAIRTAGSTPLAHAVGHAHLETAWRWPMRETRRKCQRSFSNALELIDGSEDFSFVCSQAVQWSYIEEDAPALFERMKASAGEGRFEAEGGMWVEPDANLSCGEALVRQILHARAYWMRHLGEQGISRCLNLPSAFGFPASLPQIMAQTGLELLVTSGLHRHGSNEFPHTSFIWEGIDGSEVLAHLTPGGEDNAVNTPRELCRGARIFKALPQVMPGRWLQPFGFGEGGGGPAEDHVARARLAEDCDGLPRVKLDTLRGFLDALQGDRALSRKRGVDFPRWRGELSPETHRGVLTTHGRMKRWNRRAETDLFAAELLHYAAPAAPRAPSALRARIDQAWKLLLANQSRDILPGSSVQAINDDARADHEALREELRALHSEGLRSWADAVDTSGLEDALLVFNPAGGAPRCGVIDAPDALHGGAPIWVEKLPAHGIAAVDFSRSVERSQPVPARASGMRLENEFLEVEIDAAGRVSRLMHKGSGRESGGLLDGSTGIPPDRAALNQLVLYEDRPHEWDALEIDPGYEVGARPITSPAESVRVRENGPLRARIEVSRSIGHSSRIVQTYTLAAGSPRLDVETTVEWHEEHTLLRALFPLDLVAESATYDAQFGVLERNTHTNTPWDEAQFEVCAHRFAVLSERGFGFALLNDSKYGHSCRDGVMGLSLLRSPTNPDPVVDRGEHRFTYSIMPYSGDWQSAGVLDEAQALNAPLQVMRAPSGLPARSSAERSWAPFEIEVPQGSSCLPVVDAFKSAEEGDAVCLRLHEHGGGRGEVIVHWRLDVDSVETVDLVERARAREGFVHIGHKTRLMLSPFEILTLRVSLKR